MIGDASGEEDDETQQLDKQEKAVEANQEETVDEVKETREAQVGEEKRGPSPTLSATSSEMPEQRTTWPAKAGAKQAPSGTGYCPSSNSSNGRSMASNSFRRPRYNNSQSASYGRANSWNSYEHSHGKTHGIEKKIFNDGTILFSTIFSRAIPFEFGTDPSSGEGHRV